MAALKWLSIRQSPLLSPIVCWDATQRYYTKERTLLLKLGYPVKPKRPPSAYILYVTTNRSALASQNPDLSYIELNRKLAKQWNRISESEKIEYRSQAQEKQEEYVAQLEQYNKCLTQQQKEEINEILMVYKESQKEKFLANQLKERERDLKKPKIPSTPFFMYCSEKRYSCQAKGEPLNLKELGEEWKSVPASQKEKYKAVYEKEMEKYKKDLEKWEDQMMRLGNYDLIRISTLKQKLSVSL